MPKTIVIDGVEYTLIPTGPAVMCSGPPAAAAILDGRIGRALRRLLPGDLFRQADDELGLTEMIAGLEVAGVDWVTILVTIILPIVLEWLKNRNKPS